MAKLIKHRAIVEDSWQTLFPPENTAPADVAVPPGPVIVPLPLWLARRDELRQRTDPIAVWLGPTDEPELIADDLTHLTLIAIHFPVFRDGRGYSTAALLRTRYGYTGELRAIGDVLRDQLHYLARVGFDAFALRADTSPEAALASFDDFTVAYQGAVNEPLPLFRRRAA